MKSRARQIPQAEFGFNDEPFALVAESAPVAPVASAPVILAEMTADERERLREASRAGERATFEELKPIFEAAGVQIYKSKATMAGLAPGSKWGDA